MKKRKNALELAAKDASKESNRRDCDTAPQTTSRSQTKRNKREKAAKNVWEADVALDTQHASYGKNATRFLTVSEFSTAQVGRPKMSLYSTSACGVFTSSLTRHRCLQLIARCPLLQEAMDTLRATGHTIWATDLAQGAAVLAPGAAWLGDTPSSLPAKLAIV